MFDSMTEPVSGVRSAALTPATDVTNNTAVNNLKLKIQDFSRKTPSVAMPFIKRVEIRGPQKELILCARVPKLSRPKCREVQILTINHNDENLPCYPTLQKQRAPSSGSYKEAGEKASEWSKIANVSTNESVDAKSLRGWSKMYQTENSAYGRDHGKMDAVNALENNVMNSGAVFGRIIKPELNYKKDNHKLERTEDRIFDNRPPLPIIYPEKQKRPFPHLANVWESDRYLEHAGKDIPHESFNFLERERKHFPHLDNSESCTKYKPRGRRYIPHGYGEEFEFNPHPQHIDIEYTDCGPDWKSRLRWIPSPHNPDYPAEENWPQPWKGKRTFPWMNRRTGQEWLMHPEAKDTTTLRSTWDGVHKATEVTDKEVTHSELFGKGKMVIDKRNGIPQAAPGDKNYQAVEYSSNFYKYGSTLPIVNFGGLLTFRPPTGTRSLAGSASPRKENFFAKERRRRQNEEIDSVASLEAWRPATPLQAPVRTNTQIQITS